MTSTYSKSCVLDKVVTVYYLLEDSRDIRNKIGRGNNVGDVVVSQAQLL